MDSPLRFAWFGVPAAALLLICAHLYAKYNVADRRGELAARVEGIGLERGVTGVPSEEVVEERVRGFASELGLELRALEVTVTPLSASNTGAQDRATRLVADGLRRAAAPRVRETERTEGDLSVKELRSARSVPELAGTVMEVHATVYGKKWLTSEESDIAIRKVLGRRVSLGGR